jgi:hypothetical protein
MSNQHGLPRKQQTWSGEPQQPAQRLPADFYLPGYIPPTMPPPMDHAPGSTVQPYQPPLWLTPPKRRRAFLRVLRFASKGRTATTSR